MREILYLQAGNYSNYVGTHFWNTQDTYRSLESDEGNQIDDSISFTERQNPDGTTTLYPRVVIFDWKENFGTLAQSNAPAEIREEQISEVPQILWDRHVDTYRQTRIAKSAYHAHLDEDSFDRVRMTEANKPEDIRYWSDFSHVYYLPRSIQRVPSPPTWESFEGNWTQSRDEFRRYDAANDLMDTSVRLFLEECDSIQGVQMINDISTFGGFCDIFLTGLRDEFMKLPALVFPISSVDVTHEVDFGDNQAICQIVNEALYLRSLNDQATMSVPMAMPENWPKKAGLGSRNKFPYFSSSIVSAHVESMTLSFRTKNNIYDSMDALAAQVCAAAGNLPFSEISGILLADEGVDLGHSIVNFTAPNLEYSYTPTLYSVRDVIRGFGPLEYQQYEKWVGQTVTQFRPLSLSSLGHPPTVPLSIMFPTNTPEGASLLSRLSTSSNLAHIFRTYASLVDSFLQRRPAGVTSMGIDMDDMRELVGELWTIHDRYPTDDDGFSSSDAGGSDDV